MVILWLAAVGLALRPIAPVETLSTWLSVPMRMVTALAAPLGWGRSAHAAELEGALRQALEQAATQLLEREQASVLPLDKALMEGRGLVHAEIVDRSAAGEDRLIIRTRSNAKIAVGMPVAVGDAYVGRVIQVAGASGQAALLPGEARIELLTHEEARVSAFAGECECVVGGLCEGESKGGAARRLAIHAIQGTPIPGDVLRVREALGPLTGLASLANGYRLGSLVPQPMGPRMGWAVSPALDFRGGLGQLLILTTASSDALDHTRKEGALDPTSWVAARLALRGSPSFWRETRRVHAGQRHGLLAGAAVAVGNRYLGRLAQVEYLSSQLALLGDPGSQVLVLADFGPELAPLHLGLMRARTMDRESAALELEWRASAEALRQIAARGVTRVRLFTGSGDRGVPPGLWIGSTELSRTAVDQVLQVEREAWLLDESSVEIWRPQRVGEQP